MPGHGAFWHGQTRAMPFWEVFGTGINYRATGTKRAYIIGQPNWWLSIKHLKLVLWDYSILLWNTDDQMRLQRKGKRRRVLLKSEYRLDLDMKIHNRYFLFSMIIVKKANISSHHSDISCPFMPAGCPGHWLVGTGMEGICHFENFVASGMAGIAKIAGGRAKAGTGMPVTHH